MYFVRRFPRKILNLPPKISDDLFLVINRKFAKPVMSLHFLQLFLK